MDAYSVGHGAASQDEFLERLHTAGVQAVVDIRTAPGSRRHPHFGRNEMARWLPDAGIGYRWEPRLGGFRRPAPDSPDVFWENDSFRGYAGYLRSETAREALTDLVEQIRTTPTAYMCSETLWWRCHRRLVSDALVLLRGLQVWHLLPSGRAEHRPTAGVRLADGQLIYDQLPRHAEK